MSSVAANPVERRHRPMAVWVLVCLVATGGLRAEDRILHFNRDIRPLLSDRCFPCHGPARQESGLRLDQFASATDGAIEPGNAADSQVIARVQSDDPEWRMPPPHAHRTPLTAAEIDTLRRWIDAGARYEPHWSYSPLQRTLPPASDEAGTHPIDRFIAAQLLSRGLTAAPPADRAALLRRLYLDLTGLPPAPLDVEQFLADDRPDAYERVVDQLLSSTHFGERLATWWFDLVRFADTVGYHGDQTHRITPYRDYVIKSFHENLPFDQFTIEQLAGDLLPDPDMWQLVATGYNRVLQSSHEGGIQDGEYRAKMLADRVRNVSEVWLGSSLGCAECHDHKFDPFTQQDFYQLEAIFADVDHFGSFVSVGENAIPTSRPPEMLAWTWPIYQAWTDCEQQLAELDRSLNGTVPQNYRDRQRQRADLKRRLAELESQFVPTMITKATEPRTIRVLARGNWMQPVGPAVNPRLPAWLAAEDSVEPWDRLDLARWLVSDENPLTARVIANRLWKLLLGRGISRNLLDVGSQGEWPTHPELLDWLAVEFRESGWNIKRLLRLIVTSRTYQQSSSPGVDRVALDPGNLWFSRQASYRLDAEQVRDVALAASGLLVDRLGGDVARPYQPVDYYAQLNFPEREYQPSRDDNQFRRAVYVHWQRQYLHPWLLAFDAPTREECTAARPWSNTPSAALVSLNDPSFVEAARALAWRMLESGDQDDLRVRHGWLRVTGRAPSSVETAVLLDLLARHRKHFSAQPSAAADFLSIGNWHPATHVDPTEWAAWTSVARVLLNLHETIFRS